MCVCVCVGLFLGIVVAIQSRQQQHVLKQVVHPCFSCHGRGAERRHDSICYVNVRFVSGLVSPRLYLVDVDGHVPLHVGQLVLQSKKVPHFPL